MNRKSIKILLIIISICFVSNIKKEVKGFNDNANVYLIFDKYEYLESDIVKLTINLDRFANLNEVKLRIKVNSEYLEPIMNIDGYFCFNYASIYNKYIINDFVDNEYLRFHLIKENNISDGYYSGLKNNLCEISFYVKKDINNIKDILNEKCVSLYLFDVNDSLIDYNINYSDKIKIKLNKKQYDLDVFDELPSFLDEIEILNREIDEYEIYIEEDVDNTKVGIQVLLLAVYDRRNADYEVIPITMNIIDRISPSIVCNGDFIYLDSEFKNVSFLEDVIITDNYSDVINTEVKYYDNEGNLLERNSFYDYLSNNNIGYIKIICADQVGNISETDKIKIEIIDKTKPVLNVIDSISIIDSEVESFDFEAYLTLYDDYDENPCLVIEYYDINNNKINDFLSYLLKGKSIIIKYYSSDKYNNMTDIYECIVNVIDLTKPIICNVSDMVINDIDVYNTDFFEFGYVVDNIDSDLNVNCKYYILNNEVSYKDFLDGLSSGLDGKIVYYAIDNSNNVSDEVIQNISVNDTIKPVIKLNNIENKGKYVSVDSILYSVEDNFDSYDDLIIEVLLNDSIYNKEEINVPGEYRLIIKAVDKTGNIGLFEAHFTIIEDNVIGCGDDLKCYYDNYSELIIVIVSVFVMIIGIIIGQVILNINKKKKSKN